MPLIITIITKAACNTENSAYFKRLLNCLRSAPVDPATNTDGILIPCPPVTDHMNKNNYTLGFTVKQLSNQERL